MTALADDIGHIIASEGPISLERYMGLALTHPTKGYYTTRDPFGAAGDFVTAPEISQMFGELIGLWACEIWRLCGAPQAVRLVELGPGRGTLMADALRAAKVSPEFFASIDVHLVEASDVLADRQNEALQSCGRPVFWHRTIEEIPAGPAIFVANEFFDALPVRHFVKTERGWCERLVGLDPHGALTFGLANEVEPYLKADAPLGAVLEIGAAGQRVMTQIAARVVSQDGALLAIDYGHLTTGLGETLQAMKGHQFVDPLVDPGEADLTTHVDFAALGRAAKAANAAVHGPTSQGEFLENLGVFQRAEALKMRADPTQRAEIDKGLNRLVGAEQGQMGQLFKAMAVTRRSLAVAPGFSGADGRSTA